VSSRRMAPILKETPVTGVYFRPRTPFPRFVGEALGAAARGAGDHREHLVGGAVRCVVLPAHRSERPLQHAANPHGLRTDVEAHRLLMQRALRLRRPVTLAQIVEPGRTMITLG